MPILKFENSTESTLSVTLKDTTLERVNAYKLFGNAASVDEVVRQILDHFLGTELGDNPGLDAEFRAWLAANPDALCRPRKRTSKGEDSGLLRTRRGRGAASASASDGTNAD